MLFTQTQTLNVALEKINVGDLESASRAYSNTSFSGENPGFGVGRGWGRCKYRHDAVGCLSLVRWLPAKRLPQAPVIICQQTRRHDINRAAPAVVLLGPILQGWKVKLLVVFWGNKPKSLFYFKTWHHWHGFWENTRLMTNTISDFVWQHFFSARSLNHLK